MLSKDFYVKSETQEERDKFKDCFIHVHSVGIYSAEEDNMIRNSNGDYLITYLTEGTMYFKASDGSIIPVEAGKVVIYRPDESQYLVKPSNQPHMRYWVHFLGSGVEQIFESCGIGDRNIFNIGISGEVKNLFMNIIDELQVTNRGYEVISSAFMSTLIALIARLDFSNEIAKEENPILPALTYIGQNYSKNKSIDFYASLCNMSKYYFIRSFKKYTNMTPVEYLKLIRITKAIELLELTNFKISEISEMVGYSDSLYFSRLFKKFKGISPTEYRNSILEQNP